MKIVLAALLAAPLAVLAAEGYRLDRSPHDPLDLVSLQSGARTYMNYCLGCHSLQFMRYEGLKEIGLSEAQIKDNLMFTAEKVGEPMKIAVNPKEAKTWFGVAPPDLSVIARSRGTDWLYTYLRTFYRDPKTVTGWNNAVFPNVGMPHALWTLQGQRALELQSRKKGGHRTVEYKWSEISNGTQTAAEYDASVRDLVNFLAYAGEPNGVHRRPIGIVVLFLLSIFNLAVELFSQLESLESGKEKAVERSRQHVTDRLIELAPVFTKTQHMLGDDFTMLDVAISPLLWRLDHYGIKLGKIAAPLMKYAERIFSRPAFIEALTPSEKVMRK